MKRSLHARLLRMSISIALLSVPTLASAQTGDYSDSWIDVGGRHEDEGGYSSGPSTLAEARSSGGGMVITGARHDIPESHVVTRGDTLWDISAHYYGNPYEWPRVWSYNPEITNPHWIYPQDQVRLVPADGAPVSASAPHRHVISSGPRQPDDTLWLREQGWLDPEALEQAGEVVGSPTDHMLLSPYDEVYVHFEHPNGTPEGEYTVFRELEAGQREQGETGTLVRILGTVRVDSWDPDRHVARATLIEALDPIERGFRVAAIPRRFDVVPPVRADRDVDTHVVAQLAPHMIVGSDQIVFVPLGSDDGLQLGNRLYIVRQADEWERGLDSVGANPSRVGATMESSGNTEDFPDEVIGECRVVSLRPHSAGLFVTRATRTIEVGDRAQLRQGY